MGTQKLSYQEDYIIRSALTYGIWLNLDNEQRIYHSGLCRSGLGNPANKVWTKWRKVVKVPSRRNLLTLREVCGLAACKWLQNKGRKRPTYAAVIAAVAEIKQSSPGVIQWPTGSATGAQILSLPKHRRRSRSTLYRRGLKMNKTYTYSGVQRLCNRSRRR